MCRNILELRGLDPPATPEEITAAARQYIRKVSGLKQGPAGASDDFEAAVTQVAAITAALLEQLPARRQPPPKVPPQRLPHVRERMGLPPLEGSA